MNQIPKVDDKNIGCAGRCGDVDNRPEPASATTNDKSPGNHEARPAAGMPGLSCCHDSILTTGFMGLHMTDAPVTLITGGASGIGAATARRLLDQAHRVTITGRDHHRLGPAVLIKAALPALQQTRGRIVLIGSVAGFVHTPGNIYGVTKWAVTGLAENTRRLVTGDGIGVTLIAPGRVATPFLGCQRWPSCRWTADRRPDRRRHRVGNQPAERCRRQHRDRQTDRSAWAITCRDHDLRLPYQGGAA
jgi:hypothetical protein